MASSANSITASKFDRAAIMRAAWATWRRIRRDYALWQIDRGHVDGSFASALRSAWHSAKAKAAAAEKERRLTTGPNAKRVAEIRLQIDLLKYKSINVAIDRLEAQLRAQLEAFAA